MRHEPWCPLRAVGHTDPAKRVSDTYSLHVIGSGRDSIGKWIAVTLADGRSDDTLYHNKQSAIRHQHHNENYYAFIRIGPRPMNVCEAEVYLKTQRKLHDAGLRMVDPDSATGGPEVIKRLTVEDQMAQMRGRNTNLIMPWEA